MKLRIKSDFLVEKSHVPKNPQSLVSAEKKIKLNCLLALRENNLS